MNRYFLYFNGYNIILFDMNQPGTKYDFKNKLNWNCSIHQVSMFISFNLNTNRLEPKYFGGNPLNSKFVFADNAIFCGIKYEREEMLIEYFAHFLGEMIDDNDYEIYIWQNIAFDSVTNLDNKSLSNLMLKVMPKISKQVKNIYQKKFTYCGCFSLPSIASSISFLLADLYESSKYIVLDDYLFICEEVSYKDGVFDSLNQVGDSSFVSDNLFNKISIYLRSEFERVHFPYDDNGVLTYTNRMIKKFFNNESFDDKFQIYYKEYGDQINLSKLLPIFDTYYKEIFDQLDSDTDYSNYLCINFTEAPVQKKLADKIISKYKLICADNISLKKEQLYSALMKFTIEVFTKQVLIENRIKKLRPYISLYSFNKSVCKHLSDYYYYDIQQFLSIDENNKLRDLLGITKREEQIHPIEGAFKKLNFKL